MWHSTNSRLCYLTLDLNLDQSCQIPRTDKKPREAFRSISNATGATLKFRLMAAAGLTNERARTGHVIRDPHASPSCYDVPS